MKDITLIITTCRRHHLFDRLIRSMKYYGMHRRLGGVIVVDDSPTPPEVPSWADLITTDLDAGLSYKRNLGVTWATTEFVAIFDDDFMVCPATRLDYLQHVLECDPSVRIAGGKVEDFRRGPLDHSGILRWGEPGHLHFDPIEEWRVAGKVRYGVGNMISNFFVARRQTLLLHPWNDEHKLSEHLEFFLSFWQEGMGDVAFVPSVAIEHASERSGGYRLLRDRAVFWLGETFDRWEIEEYHKHNTGRSISREYLQNRIKQISDNHHPGKEKTPTR